MKKLKRMTLLVVILLVLPILLIWLILAQPSYVRNRASPAEVDAAKLKEHVVTLSRTYFPRDYSNVENLDKCAEYIRSHLESAGARVSLQEFDTVGATYKNVRGVFGPEDGARVVVGAHYDACRSTPGADDNASGVAGLIELAYLLGRAELELMVELVAFPLEEPPFFETEDMGSAHHARLLRHEGREVRAMIGLEMIGYFRDKFGSQKFPIPVLWLYYPARGNFIAVVGSMTQRKLVRTVKSLMRGSTDLPVHSLNAPRFVPGIDFSDHMNYWDQGYDAVMVSDSAFYRNNNYHEPTDTADTLDYERMAKVVVAVYEAVKGLIVD